MLLGSDSCQLQVQVKPVLNRLKATLVGLGLAISATTLLLIFLPAATPQPDPAPPRPYSGASPPLTTRFMPYDESTARKYEPWGFEEEGGEAPSMSDEGVSGVGIPGHSY